MSGYDPANETQARLFLFENAITDFAVMPSPTLPSQ